MPLSMIKRLGCGDPKSSHMTLTLVDHLVTYPYEILEDVLVTVDDLVFPTNFVILDMPEDVETPLTLGRPFMETRRALSDVYLGELASRFNKEKVFFNMFEAIKHSQCYKVSKLLQPLKKWTPIKETLRVKLRV